MKTDGELLRGYAREHSEAAFAELVERHVGLVFQAALRRTNQHAALADEVTQAVFTSVAREAGKLSQHSALTGWLYVATRHAAAKAMRAEIRRRKYTEELSTMQATERSEAGDVEWGRLKAVLDDVMDSLSEHDREAVLLRFFEGKAFGEIGTALRVSEDAARVRVNRALEKMRGLLAKRGVTSTAAALGGLLAGNAAVAAPAGMAASVTSVALVSAVGAAAGVSAAGAAGIFAFMTTTKLVTGVACVVAAVSLGTAVWQNRKIDELRAQTVSLREENTRLSAKGSLGDVASQSSDRLERMADSSAGASGEKEMLLEGKNSAVSSTESRLAVDPVKAVADRLAPVLLDPAYQELSMKVHRAAMPMTYGAFYRKQRLTAEQINRLEGLLTERKQNQIDLLVAAQTQGMSISDPSLPRLKSTETDVALRALLGDGGYGEFERYEKTLPAREEVERVAAGVYYTEAPLSLAQGEALAEIIAANTKSGPAQGLVELPGEVDWQAVYADAANVLSPVQLRAMQTQKEKADIDQRFLSLRMKLLRKENARSGGR